MQRRVVGVVVLAGRIVFSQSFNRRSHDDGDDGGGAGGARGGAIGGVDVVYATEQRGGGTDGGE